MYYYFKNQHYDKKGYLVKDLSTKIIQVCDVQPTIEELMWFPDDDDDDDDDDSEEGTTKKKQKSLRQRLEVSFF